MSAAKRASRRPAAPATPPPALSPEERADLRDQARRLRENVAVVELSRQRVALAEAYAAVASAAVAPTDDYATALHAVHRLIEASLSCAATLGRLDAFRMQREDDAACEALP